MTQIGRVMGVISAVFVCFQPVFAGAEAGHDMRYDPGVHIVSAVYGKPGKRHVLDITEKVQDLCGPAAQRCSVFCSDSSFGRSNLGRKSICRVTYACGASYVRSIEAWREELILLRCPDHRDELVGGAAPVAN